MNSIRNQATAVFRSMALFVREATRKFKEGGFRALISAYGWRLVVCFFIYYLIRDLTLYVAIPYLAFKGCT